MINNKKILIGIIFAVFAVLLTSCKASDALSVDVKEYFAKKDNGFDIIYDYESISNDVQKETEHQIEKIDLVFSGTCKNCLKTKN